MSIQFLEKLVNVGKFSVRLQYNAKVLGGSISAYQANIAFPYLMKTSGDKKINKVCMKIVKNVEFKFNKKKRSRNFNYVIFYHLLLVPKF